jgi:hypothetical protein
MMALFAPLPIQRVGICPSRVTPDLGLIDQCEIDEVRLEMVPDLPVHIPAFVLMCETQLRTQDALCIVRSGHKTTIAQTLSERLVSLLATDGAEYILL